MKVVVVGGAGFIGGHVVDRLRTLHDVVVYDKAFPDPKYAWSDVEYVLGTLDEDYKLRAHLKGADVVYHLASVSNTFECVKDPIKAVDINCGGTVRLFTACRDMGVGKVITASSSLLSGLLEDEMLKIRESYHIYVTTKVFQEMLARDFYKMYGLPYTVLRFGICYGPRMTPGVVVHTFIKQALDVKPITIQGNGRQWRQYTYVHDLADLAVKVINGDGGTYNIVSNSRTTINDIAATIKEFIPNIYVEYVDARSHDLEIDYMDNTAFHDEFGKYEYTSLRDGIGATIDHYKKVGI